MNESEIKIRYIETVAHDPLVSWDYKEHIITINKKSFLYESLKKYEHSKVKLVEICKLFLLFEVSVSKSLGVDLSMDCSVFIDKGLELIQTESIKRLIDEKLEKQKAEELKKKSEIESKNMVNDIPLGTSVLDRHAQILEHGLDKGDYSQLRYHINCPHCLKGGSSINWVHRNHVISNRKVIDPLNFEKLKEIGIINDQNKIEIKIHTIKDILRNYFPISESIFQRESEEYELVRKWANGQDNTLKELEDFPQSLCIEELIGLNPTDEDFNNVENIVKNYRLWRTKYWEEHGGEGARMSYWFSDNKKLINELVKYTSITNDKRIIMQLVFPFNTWSNSGAYSFELYGNLIDEGKGVSEAKGYFDKLMGMTNNQLREEYKKVSKKLASANWDKIQVIREIIKNKMGWFDNKRKNQLYRKSIDWAKKWNKENHE